MEHDEEGMKSLQKVGIDSAAIAAGCFILAVVLIILVLIFK